MTPRVEGLVERAHDVEDDLRRVIGQSQRQWGRRVNRSRIWFDRELRRRHRRLKLGIVAYIRQGSIINLLTAPVIYSLIVPFALLDLWVTLYQSICFPVYGIARVPRRRYFAIDRHRLAYLNGIEKLNCAYCSYANGVIAYVREVAGRTEQYWCPIKHARRIPAPHRHYAHFFEYGEAAAYRHGLSAKRHELRPAPRHSTHSVFRPR
jgi:hypothetical protein